MKEIVFKENDERPEVLELWAALRKALPDLEKLLKEMSGHWTYEDGIYRLYHQSFKVFRLQERTLAIVEALKKLAPPPGKEFRFRFYFEKDKRPAEPPVLHPWFMQIVQDGTGKEFDMKDNQNWLPVTRPIVEAFLHAKYFLEMAVQYAKELQAPPNCLPSGWASVLYLYGLR
jgi:hypothetical protein